MRVIRDGFYGSVRSSRHAESENDSGREKHEAVSYAFSEGLEHGYPCQYEQRDAHDSCRIRNERVSVREERLVVDDESARRDSERGEEPQRGESENERKDSVESERNEPADSFCETNAHARSPVRTVFKHGFPLGCLRNLGIFYFRAVLHENGKHEIRENARSVEEKKNNEEEPDKDRIDVEFVSEARAYSEDYPFRTVAIERGFQIRADGLLHFIEIPLRFLLDVGEYVFGFSEFVHYLYAVTLGSFRGKQGKFFGNTVFDIFEIFRSDSVFFNVAPYAGKVVREERFRAV